jgi:Fur family transcriptional regulator, ferric uptake regulator
MSQAEPIRMTTQRRLILQELGKLTSHPTADDLYGKVRRLLPRISLGTVYRNLELLSQAGMILRLSAAGGQRRFDANTSQHYHIRCDRCGRVDDAALKVTNAFEKAMQKRCNYRVTGHWLEFTGICPSCLKRR